MKGMILMPKMTPYFLFNGNCKEVLEFYSKVFETEAFIETYGDAPANPDSPISENIKNLVSHAELKLDGEIMMFGDVLPNSPVLMGNNLATAFRSNDVNKIKKVYNALSENAVIKMSLQETPWSICYGALTDKFGMSWFFNYDKSLNS